MVWEGAHVSLIDQELGRRLTPQEVAELLGLDVKTVRKYHHELGGIRVGSRILFFEKELIDAVQTRRKMDRTGAPKRTETGEGTLDKEGSSQLGSGHAESTRRRLAKNDKHGLFG
jgi:excisionase family DNA binding protein